MKKTLTYLTLSVLILLVGCFDSDDNSDTSTFETQLTSIEILQEDSIITSRDTLWIDVELESNTPYELKIKTHNSSFGVWGNINTLEGEQVGAVNQVFMTGNDTKYKLRFDYFNSYDTTTIKFTYSLHKYDKINSTLNGMWLLTKETWKLKDYSQSLAYTTDSANQVLFINGDSLTQYEYIVGMDSIRHISLPFQELFQDCKIHKRSESEFSITKAFFYGVQKLDYVRYNGDIGNLKWDNKETKIPKELYGKWYISSKTIVTANDYYEGPISKTFHEEYNDVETNTIYTIDGSGIVSYKRNGWSYSKQTEYLQSTYDFCKHATLENNKLLYKRIQGILHNEDEYHLHYNESVYKEISGELPLEQWQKVSIPNETFNLEVNSICTTSFSKGDTLWFSLPLENGVTYNIETFHDSIEGNTSRYILDPNDKQLYHNEWYNFTAQHSGNYHVVLIPHHLYDDTVIENVTCIVSLKKKP